MLQTLKNFYKYNIPFYGINSGSYGFLMNKFSPKKLIKNLRNANTISISPLEMRALTKTGKICKVIAINEVSLFRQTRQTSLLKIEYGKKI